MTQEDGRSHGRTRGLTRREALRLVGRAAGAAAAATLWPRPLRAQASLCSGVSGTTLRAFSTPACVRDFTSAALQAEMDDRWSRNVDQWTRQAIVGNPWGSNLDSNRAWYFNPLTTPIPAGSPTKLVEWIAFPNRITSYLGSPRHRFTNEQLLELADNGRLADGTTLPWIPDNVCPYIDTAPLPAKPYGPAGPRGWQDEYCEWAVERDAAGEIVRVSFTCENPEYWHTLWSVDENRVLELYRQLVSPRVQLADLYLRDAAGKVVHDPFVGRPAYDALNKWNDTTRARPDSGGAVHLTSPPNNLGAEIGLGAAATLLRFEDDDPQDLICCTPYGQSFRHSDPHIGFTVNQGVRGLGMRVTVADPVGLYIQEPDFGNYELPAEAVRAGLAPKDFWTLVRGTPGMGLHAVFRAPRGYTQKLSAIRISGQPLRWASQIAQTFQIGLRGTFIPQGGIPAQQYLACPNDENPAPNRPSPQQLLPYEVMRAYAAAGKSGVSSTAAPVARRGETLRDVALVTTGTTADTPVRFEADDIHVDVKRFIQGQLYHVPGNTNPGTFNVFVLDIRVGPAAPTGAIALRLGTGFNAAAPAFLTVKD
jgi:hypothetical protein